MATCQTCARELDPTWKFCTTCGTPTRVRSGRKREPLMSGPRIETSSRARSRSRTDSAFHEAASMDRWRRSMVAGIAVLLFIAATTAAILFVVANA
jgi:hypothetical protein